MKTTIISIFTFSILLIGCENNSKKENKPKVENEEHEHSENTKIELNNGGKWAVKPEMLVHIRIMETEVNLFKKSETKDYKLLAKKLQENIESLTSNCTMTGKAHDELHKWLLPYIDLVTDLSDVSDKALEMKNYENIEASFKTFNQFFN